jgi:hypothetical protein
LRGRNVGLRAALPVVLALTAAFAAFGMLPGRAGSASAAATTLSVDLSSPMKVHGLLAEQTFVVSNTGASDARSGRAHIAFAASITVQSVTWPNGKCTVATTAVDCRLGTVRAGATVTLRALYRLNYVPPTTNNAVRISAGNAPAVTASGPSYFLNRYWICGCSTVYTYPNGWSVPATDQGVTVGPDDTVFLPESYRISPDGVLHFPDGRMIKDSLTSERFIARKK